MVATQQPNSPQAWYSDIGATHLVTSDLGYLSLHAPYHGSDTVQVGNGQGISISTIGTATLHTPLSGFSL